MISSKTAAEIIAELNDTDETDHIEAKLIGDDEAGKSVFETICAMSNEPDLGGGTILLGVEKEELSLFPFFVARGVQDPEKISSDIATACSGIFNAAVRLVVTTERVSKVNVVRIDVPELPPHQKPIYFTKRGLPQGAFRRIGATDQKCKEEDLLAFYRGKEASAYDTTIVANCDPDDLDQTAVEAYRRFAKEANILAEEVSWSDEDLVHALGGLHKLDGKLRVTIAGLALFGKQASLRRLYPSLRVDYIRVPGKTWIRDVSDRFESIVLRGPLMTLVGRVISTILDDLPRAFRFDDTAEGQRTELPALPVRAIREAVVNCLIHRNYQTSQPIQIIRYANRVEFKNPGYSLKSTERFDDPASMMRNPHIAEALHEARFAETKGSGIRRIRQLMEGNGLSPPAFNSDRESDSFTAIFLFHHFLNPDDWRWLSNFRKHDLSDDQNRALIFLREVGAIDNQTYRGLTHTDAVAAGKSLRKLKSALLLEDRGTGPRTYYVPGPALSEHLPAPDLLDSPSNLIGSDLNPLDSHGPIDLRSIPKATREKVTAMALGRRGSSEELEKLILELCDWRALSSVQIATLLARNSNYLTNNYLTELVELGKLQYLHPDQPSHPSQKYLSAGTGRN